VGTAFLHETEDREDFGIAPFYFGGRGVSGDYDVSPPLFWSFREGAKSSTFLPPLLTYFQTRPTGFTLNVFPFFVFAGREGTDHHTFVPPLFWRWGDAIETSTIVGPAFLHETTTKSDFGFVPLYFGSRGIHGDYDVSPLLFWSFREEEQHTLVLPPLLTYYRKTPESRHLLVLPFFDYRETDTTQLLVSPLAVHAKGPGFEATVIGGLYWHLAGPELEARIVGPIYWDFKAKTPGTRLTTVFPLYWRYEKPEETTQLFLNVMWSYGKTKLGPSWGFHFFPFVDLVSYHPDHFLWQVLLGALGRETQADSARWRVGWVWTEPTKISP
jgi:hypothetical protein